MFSLLSDLFARLCTCFKDPNASETSSLGDVPVPLRRVNNVGRGEDHLSNSRKRHSPSPEVPQDRGLGTIKEVREEETTSLSRSLSDILDSFL